MPALVAGIHVYFFDISERKTWMAGTSPAMATWGALKAYASFAADFAAARLSGGFAVLG
jgi:hypothetical protein